MILLVTGMTALQVGKWLMGVADALPDMMRAWAQHKGDPSEVIVTGHLVDKARAAGEEMRNAVPNEPGQADPSGLVAAPDPED